LPARRPGIAEAPGASRFSLVLLLAALIFGSWLRHQDVTRVGVRFDDESWYVSDARFWHRGARTLLHRDGLAALARGDKQALAERLNTERVDFRDRYPKSCLGYTFPAALLMFAVGDGPEALTLLSAVAGSLSLVVLYCLALALFDRAAALGAVILLACSPYHLLYSRLALTDATTGLFVLLGVLLWTYGWRGTRPRGAYLASGLAFGVAFASHHRSLPALAILLAADWLFGRPWLSRSAQVLGRNAPDSAPRFGRRAAWLLAGFALPLMVLEGLLGSAQMLAARWNAYWPVPTFWNAIWDYAGILLERIGLGEATLGNPSVVAAYAEYVIHWHGLLFALFLALGLVVLVRAPGRAKYPAILIVLTVLLLTSQRYVVARALSPLLPFLCLAAALGIRSIVGRVLAGTRQAEPCVAAAALVLALPGLARSLEVTNKRSQVADACAFLIEQGDGAAVVPMNARKYEIYLEHSHVKLQSLGFDRVADPPEAVLAELRRNGVRWMVTDPQHWHCLRPSPPDHGVFDWWERMEITLNRSARLAAEFPHLRDFRWEFLAEGWGLSGLKAMTDRGAGAIRVYDLRVWGPPDSSTCPGGLALTAP
jgi:hypothetical protein